MNRAATIIKAIVKWIFSHKKVLFIYLPIAVTLISMLFVLIVYVQWRGDRDAALTKLSRYKRLIDRTEEMKKGYVYHYKDVDLSAKVVDIPTRIYDRNNEVIGEFFEQKREIVPYDYIPQWLVKAVIASEDRAFYKHNGISYQGIIRAFFVNLVHFRVVQGGSTITQQLAKVLFTDMERNLKRKVYEAFCAREIEKRYDKQDILSMYLNLIYFGNGAYGVESASKMFFGTSVRELDEVESSMIVASISNPRIYSPLRHLNNSIKKTERILQSLVDAGFMKKKVKSLRFKHFLRKWKVEFNAKGDAESSLIGNFIYSSYRINRAPFFNEGIRRILVERFGEDIVKRGGLRVYTTIDGKKQDAAMNSLHAGILRQRKYHQKIARRTRNQKRALDEMANADNIEGALISLDPFTGEILAYAGGYEFSSRNQNDSVSQIRRQPGSSFKPIVYTAAIEDRIITPSTIFMNKRTRFKGGYSPRNYDNTYSGKIIVRDALCRSVNVVAVKVLQKEGYDTIFEILKKALHLSSSELKERFHRTLSLALGTYELSPMENCVLQSTILNGGEYILPYGIELVKDYNDNVIWDNGENVRRTVEKRRRETGKIIDPAAGAVTISMLRGDFEKGGTGYYIAKNRKISFPIAGKTGTSTNFVDAWFVGYTARLVTTVWIGNKSGSVSLGPGRAGGVVAGPVWGDYIASIYRENPPGEFKLPDEGISQERICLDSGFVAGRHGECPRVEKQVFISGSEPGEYCPLHVKKETEEQGNDPDPSIKEKK